MIAEATVERSTAEPPRPDDDPTMANFEFVDIGGWFTYWRCDHCGAMVECEGGEEPDEVHAECAGG